MQTTSGWSTRTTWGARGNASGRTFHTCRRASSACRKGGGWPREGRCVLAAVVPSLFQRMRGMHTGERRAINQDIFYSVDGHLLGEREQEEGEV